MSQPSALTRRSHRKSRGGCVNCKQRRVKCDQAKPACSTCLRREVDCTYAGSGSPVRIATSTQVDHSDLIISQPADSSLLTPTRSSSIAAAVPLTTGEAAFGHDQSYDGFDLRLMAHFCAYVCPALDSEPSPIDWTAHAASSMVALPHLGHAVLAFSACHMMRLEEESRSLCIQKSADHHSAAVSSMVDELRNLSDRNADGLFLTAVMLCLFNFASGPQPGQYLTFTDDADAVEWIWLLKGVRSIMPHASPTFRAEMPSLLEDWSSSSRGEDGRDGLEQFEDHLTSVEHAIVALVGDQLEQKLFVHAAEQLRDCWIMTGAGSSDRSFTPQVIFKWLYGLAPEYLAKLKVKHTVSLLIFACFDVLLHQLRHIWYIGNWSLHIMSGIHRHLPQEQRPLLAWPSQIIGWSPADQASS